MDDFIDWCVTILTALIIMVLVIGGLVLYYAWAFNTLWNWFIAPLGISEINMWHAYGIMMFFGLFTNKYSGDYSGKEPSELVKPLITNLSTPALSVLVGWWIKNYI